MNLIPCLSEFFEPDSISILAFPALIVTKEQLLHEVTNNYKLRPYHHMLLPAIQLMEWVLNNMDAGGRGYF